MSHLIMKKIQGKFRMFNRKTKKVEGKPMDNKKEAEKKTKARDKVEDKEMGKGGGKCSVCGKMNCKDHMGKGGGKAPMDLHLKKGALHKELGVKEDKKIPASKLAIHEGDSPKEKKRKQFAINAKKWHHGGA